MIGLTHPELVSDLFTAFLARHATTASTVVPLDLSYALHTVAALGNNPGILRRDPRQPESYSLLTPEEKAEAAQTLARYKVLEESCTLWLPGVNDKEEWEKDPSSTVRARQPWKLVAIVELSLLCSFCPADPPASPRFSTRNQTEIQRPMSARKSLVESISVETQAARSVSESPLPPMPEMSNLNLDSSSSIPPPVPPKDLPATPTMNEGCGTRGETWMGAGAGGARTRLH